LRKRGGRFGEHEGFPASFAGLFGPASLADVLLIPWADGAADPVRRTATMSRASAREDRPGDGVVFGTEEE